MKINATNKLLQILKRSMGKILWTLEAGSTYSDGVWGRYRKQCIGKGDAQDGMPEWK